jgi:hypothetical protein
MHNTLTSLFFSFPALLEFGNPAVSQNPARWLSMSAPGSQVADGGEDACLPSVAERSPCSAPSRDPMFFCARWSRSIPWSNWSNPRQLPGPPGIPPPANSTGQRRAPQRQRPHPGCGSHGLALPGPAELAPGPCGSLCRAILMWGRGLFSWRAWFEGTRSVRSHGAHETLDSCAARRNYTVKAATSECETS